MEMERVFFFEKIAFVNPTRAITRGNNKNNNNGILLDLIQGFG